MARRLAASKKGALKEGYLPVFVDESAYYLLPGVVSTWAPSGETPVISVPLTHDHLSAIAAVTEEGKLSVMVQEDSIHGTDVVRFLRHLIREWGDCLFVGWDGASIHKNDVVKEFLSSEEGSKIRLFAWPAYAPDLDPAEGVWEYTKQVLLRNTSHNDFHSLRGSLNRAFNKLRLAPDIIHSFFRKALL